MITRLACDPLFEFEMSDIEQWNEAQNYEHFRQDNELGAWSLFKCYAIILFGAF